MKLKSKILNRNNKEILCFSNLYQDQYTVYLSYYLGKISQI